MRTFAIIVVALAGASAAAAADRKPPTDTVRGLERFVHSTGSLCQKAPADACVDAGWRYADSNRDRGLSLAELRRVRRAVEAWLGWKGDAMVRRERATVLFGLFIVDAVGLDALFDDYDADRDGLVSREELLADVRLDERPLGKVLGDAEAVDRRAIARRLGKLAPLLDGYYQ